MAVCFHRPFPVVTALVMSFWLAACSAESRTDAGGEGDSAYAEDAGEHDAEEGGAEGLRAEGSGEHRGGGEAREGGEHREGGEGGEHAEGGEHGGEVGHYEEGEESGVYVGSNETWDASRNGVRLVLSFDPAANAFLGSVENTNPLRVCAVRVEVHLSTGTELGPTERTDLDPGQTASVKLPTEGEAFDAWTTHPEMSPCGTR